MQWKLVGSNGLWLGWDGQLVGHPEALGWAADLAGQSLPMTPTGPGYVMAWPPDEVAAWLAATKLLSERNVSGKPPRLPLPKHRDDVVY